MSRDFFGNWGLDLNDEDFACALAAYGTLSPVYTGRIYESRERIETELEFFLHQRTESRLGDNPWHIVRWDGWPISQYKFHQDYRTSISAQFLTEAWKRMAGNLDIRIEIQAEHRRSSNIQDPLLWISDQLSLSAVGARSVYISYIDDDTIAHWTWPINVGCLDDQASNLLFSELQNRFWPHLSTIDINSSDWSTLDVLLLPWSLRESVSRVLSESTPIYSSMVIVFGELSSSWENNISLRNILMKVTGAAGLCIANVSKNDRLEWYNIFIEEISHNMPIDVALHAAGLWCKRQSYFFSTPQLIANANLTNVIDRMADQVSGLSDEMPISLDTKSAHFLNLREGLHTPADIETRLREAKDIRSFFSEAGDATDLATLAVSMKDIVGPANAWAKEPRWIQAQVFNLTENINERLIKSALRPDTSYSLNVFIGPIDPEVDSLIAPRAIPEEILPPDETEHILTVVFSEPHHVPEPKVSTIKLPREGRSTQCKFTFRTLSDNPNFEGRIIILHKNRILQTAMLRSSVGIVTNLAEEKISLTMETVINPSFIGLKTRRHFDAAFYINQSGDGNHRGTGATGDKAFLFYLDGILQCKATIDDLLTKVTETPTKYAKLEDDATVELLVDLARQGRSLYEAIVTDQFDTDKPFEEAKRIQIVSNSSQSPFFPIEFVYDLPAPEDGSKLCRNAKNALLNGKCKKCPEDTDDGKTRVCPLGFWGMQRVIERYIDPRKVELPARLSREDYAITAIPVNGRKTLNPYKASLFAASENVDKYEDPNLTQDPSDFVLDLLKNEMPNSAEEVKTWKGWTEQIRTLKPSMLVLMPHTVKRGGLPALEIGEEGSIVLELLQIEKTKHVVRGDTTPPLVLLLGCKTMLAAGGLDIPFQSLIAKFRREGAAIVLSSRINIRGQHAVPVFKKILDIFNQLSQTNESKSFGDVMLLLRRQAIAADLLMVLCLFAYGDADWQLDFS